MCDEEKVNLFKYMLWHASLIISVRTRKKISLPNEKVFSPFIIKKFKLKKAEREGEKTQKF